MTDDPKPDTQANGEALNGAPSSDLVIPLRKAVIAHGDEVKELKFREPTAADIEVCGTPVMIDFLASDTPKMTFETKAMFAMMSRLAAVPPSTIRSMHPKDWNGAAMALAYRFFIPEI